MIRQFLPVLHVLGYVVALFALTLLVPLAVAAGTGDGLTEVFVTAVLLTFFVGVLLGRTTRRFRRPLQPRDGYLLVALVWTGLPAIACLPLLLALPALSFTDAYFEAASALTSTGATVLTGLDHLPPSLNIWRCFMVWIGGMGVLVLAVAILPLLGIGGSQIFKAEMPGPMKDARLAPRIAETAKILYTVYAVLSVACLLAYRLAGMSWLDAAAHMFTTMSLGGFSTHDASFAFFDSPLIEAVAVVFMLLAGLNFAVHFIAWRGRSLKPYFGYAEGRWFLGILAGAVLLVTLVLLAHGTYSDFATAFRHAAFNVVSVATTAGFANTDYALWPAFAPILMLLLGCFVSCAGSTGGGVKLMRTLILLKQARRELTRVLHPRVVSPVTIGTTTIENNVIFAILAYMLLYGVSLISMVMLLLLSGLDFMTALTAVVASLNNIGPGLGSVGPSTTYAVLNDFQTWVCAFAMLLGRLELFAILVLFTPAFWRK